MSEELPTRKTTGKKVNWDIIAIVLTIVGLICVFAFLLGHISSTNIQMETGAEETDNSVCVNMLFSSNGKNFTFDKLPCDESFYKMCEEKGGRLKRNVDVQTASGTVYEDHCEIYPLKEETTTTTESKLECVRWEPAYEMKCVEIVTLNDTYNETSWFSVCYSDNPIETNDNSMRPGWVDEEDDFTPYVSRVYKEDPNAEDLQPGETVFGYFHNTVSVHKKGWCAEIGYYIVDRYDMCGRWEATDNYLFDQCVEYKEVFP